MRYTIKLILSSISCYLLFSLAAFLTPEWQAQEWTIKGKEYKFSLDEKEVFQSSKPWKALPVIATKDQIRAALYLGEYYLNRNDKKNVANLLYLLRTSKKDFQLVDAFINAIWFLDRNDKTGGSKKLSNYADKTTSLNHKTIANALRIMLFEHSINDLIKEIPEVKQLNCQKEQEYFEFCSLIKLKIALDNLERSTADYYSNYQLVNDALRPFLKNRNMFYIFFVDRLIPKLAPRLAYLGFGYEATFFQKMQIQSETLSAFFNIISYERLAFYYMLTNNLSAAEATLESILPRLKNKHYQRNNINLKLAAIAYFHRDYKKSLQYYLSLDLKYWSKRIRHPFFDKPLTINAARDLIAISIWKAKSASRAIEALSKIKAKKKISISNLFVKLRIAHIMMRDRPDIAQKISNEIIYLAQGRGWRRLEYAATMMNGFTHILLNNKRKAIIQFTKTYGILGRSDPFFSSEWSRNLGLFRARLAKRQYRAADRLIQILSYKMERYEYSDEILSMKHYLDERFNIDSFFRYASDFYLQRRRYPDLLYLFYNYHNFRQPSKLLPKKGIMQLTGVHRRIEIYKGFRPSQDNSYYQGIWKKLRRKAKEKLYKEYYQFDKKFYRSFKDPFVTCYEFKNTMYVMAYHPRRRKWSVKKFDLSIFNHTQVFENLETSMPLLMRSKNIHVYMNHIGAELLQYFKRRNANSNYRFFYNYSMNTKKLPDSLYEKYLPQRKLVIWDNQ